MATVTMELRKILSVQNFDLFDFDYPVLNASWKVEFEKVFKDYYFFHEIGSETADRFKQRLKARLNLIMPKYVDQYDKMSLLVNPLEVERLTTTEVRDLTKDRTRTGENSVNLTGATTSTDYPQHASIVDDIPTVKSQDTSNSTGSQLETVGDLENENKTVTTIKTGGINEVLELLKLKDNITEQVINECKTLFILVY